MSVKPLSTLLAQADAFIKGESTGDGVSKVASTQCSEVSALAELLLKADTDVQITVEPEVTRQTEIDKLAESLNRIHAAAEIDALLKLDQFEKMAQSEGFADDQIQEAIMKIASEKIAKNLPIIAALGAAGLPSEDKNKVPSKKSPTGKTRGALLGRVNIAKSMGY